MGGRQAGIAFMFFRVTNSILLCSAAAGEGVGFIWRRRQSDRVESEGVGSTFVVLVVCGGDSGRYWRC